MTDLLKDIRFGCRMLLQSPGFTLVAILSLALGIGFNTTIFSAVDSVLLRPKAGVERSRLVELYLADSSGYPYAASSYLDYREYRDRNDVFTGVAAFQTALVHYRSGGSGEYLIGEIVTGNFFEVLGIRARLGRMISHEDDVDPGGHPVAVVSEPFWQARLGGDPEVLGDTLDLNGRPYSIVGVAPETFVGNFPGLSTNFWVPAAMTDHMNPMSRDGASRLERRTNRSWLIKARLDPGVTLEQAQARMVSLSAALREEYPDEYRDRAVSLLPSSEVRLHPMVDQALFPAATVLMATVGLVLLIACANVANMLLARASARQGEVAIRLALGSSKWRLVRQLLTESILLSSLGGLGGLLIAFWSTKLLLALRPPIPVPIALDLTLSGRVLLFTLGASLLTGVVFGLAPALQASRASLVRALKSDLATASVGVRRLTLRNALVVLQVAVSLVLLLGAGLMLRSAGNAQAIDPGFETEKVVMLSTHVGLHGYDEERGRAYYQRAVERMESLAEFESASLADKVPLGAGVSTRSLAPEGQEPERDGDWPDVDSTTVAPGYFAVMDIPLISGRDFTERDADDSPGVVILNETACRRFWPGENPIGKRVVTMGSRALWEVVGVARDTKVRTLGEDGRPQVFFPFAQDYSPMMYIVGRTRGAPEAALVTARRELFQIDDDVAFFESKTMPQNLAITLFPVRMGALLLGVFGALALLLAAIGLYGVIAYSVSRRTREIGIRMALGASRGRVLTLLTKQGLALVLVGCALGLVGGVLATRVLSNVLYGIGSTDVATFAATAFVLIAVAFVANWIPARRAARVEPVTALRYE